MNLAVNIIIDKSETIIVSYNNKGLIYISTWITIP